MACSISQQILLRDTSESSRSMNGLRTDGNSDDTTQEHESTGTCATTSTILEHSNVIAKKLNTSQLAILVFYNVSGGPFGIEPSLRSAGNFYTILGFALLPFLWSLPEALVTAELGSAFQSSSGGVIWVECAFGKLPGVICGYFNWISGATDNAIYPALFLTYVAGDTLDGFTRFCAASILSLILAGLNFLGLEIVGNASLLVCVIAISPFVIMTVLGASKVDPSKWLQMPMQLSDDGASELFDDDFQTSPGLLPSVAFGICVRPFLNNMFWNLNSFDSASSFAKEVVDVKTVYPRGIFIGLALCYVLYLVPLLVVTGSTDYDQKDWVDGLLGSAAREIGGDLLGKWTLFAIGISNLALFEAEMSADAYQLMGMAEQGYLPSFFKTRSKFGTPTAGICAGTVFIILFSVADFGQLVELLNANYAIALLMEYAAFVKLRHDRKDLHRPFRVPISDAASKFLVLPPCLGILLLLAVSSWMTYFCVTCVFAISLGLVGIQHVFKEKGWLEFEEFTPFEHDAQVAQQEDGNHSNDVFELANENVRLVLPSSGTNQIT